MVVRQKWQNVWGTERGRENQVNEKKPKLLLTPVGEKGCRRRECGKRPTVFV